MTARKFLVVGTVAVALLALGSVAHAANEVGSATSLGELISDTYAFSLKIVGISVFIMFLYAGYSLLFGNAGAAKKAAQDAVIGMLLLFSAVVILNSINPDLAKQDSTVPPLPGAPAR